MQPILPRRTERREEEQETGAAGPVPPGHPLHGRRGLGPERPSADRLAAFLFDKDGNLLLGRLEDAKRAGLWTAPFEVPVPPRADPETVVRAALRKALGVEPADLHLVGALTEREEEMRRVLRLFSADLPPGPLGPERLAGLRSIPLEEVRGLVASGRTTETFRRLFELYEERERAATSGRPRTPDPRGRVDAPDPRQEPASRAPPRPFH